MFTVNRSLKKDRKANYMQKYYRSYEHLGRPLNCLFLACKIINKPYNHKQGDHNEHF